MCADQLRGVVPALLRPAPSIEFGDLRHFPTMRSKKNLYGSLNVSFSAARAQGLLCFSLASSQAVEKSVPEAPKPTTVEKKIFFARWAEFYRQDWSGTIFLAGSDAARCSFATGFAAISKFRLVVRRLAGDWGTGHQQLSADDGDQRSASRTKIYGWVDPSLNFSTSSNRNEPEANDVYSNRLR